MSVKCMSMGSKNELLYREPRRSYLLDRLQNLSIPIIVVIAVILFLVFRVIEPNLANSEKPDSNLLFLALFALAVLLVTILILFLVISFIPRRSPFEILSNEIRLPYPRKKGLRTRWKAERNVLSTESIESVRLDVQKVKTPFKSLSSQEVWKCTIVLKNGEKVILSRATPGCHKPQCLEAIRKFVRIFSEHNSTSIER